jgi:polysaccharide export outer membrane protein
LKKLAILALAGAIAAPATAQDGYYSIKPGDVLSIRVLEDPSLTSQVLVRPDGRISLPIAGSVMAEGRSPERLEAVLRSRLAKGFELTPTVTVSLMQVAPIDQTAPDEMDVSTYYLMGQIARPGPVAVEKPLTLLQALALAGGPGPFADVEKIQVRRRGDDGAEELMFFDYTRVEDGLPVTDIDLQDKDLIFVPERGLF